MKYLIFISLLFCACYDGQFPQCTKMNVQDYTNYPINITSVTPKYMDMKENN